MKMKRVLFLFVFIVISLCCKAQISARYALGDDIERYGDKALAFEFKSNGGVTKYDYKRNYYGITDWNATCTYGRYTITENAKRETKITIIWSNGKQEKYLIDYHSNSRFSILRTIDNGTSTRLMYREVL